MVWNPKNSTCLWHPQKSGSLSPSSKPPLPHRGFKSTPGSIVYADVLSRYVYLETVSAFLALVKWTKLVLICEPIRLVTEANWSCYGALQKVSTLWSRWSLMNCDVSDYRIERLRICNVALLQNLLECQELNLNK